MHNSCRIYTLLSTLLLALTLLVLPTTLHAQQTITYDTTVSGEVTSRTGDRWTFQGEDGDIITISLLGSFDTYLELRDSDNRLLTEDDDSGRGNNALIAVYRLPASGNYTIIARGYSGNTGSYRLSLASAQANHLDYGEMVEHEITSEAGQLWTFTGEAGDAVQISMDSEVLDAYLVLYDANGEQLIRDEDSGQGFNARINRYLLPEDGSYTISARSEDGSIGAYTLTLAKSDVAELSYGEPTSATLTEAGSSSWSFTGEAGDFIRIDLVSDAFNAQLELYNAENERITRDEDSGLGDNARIVSVLPKAGTYTVLARASDNKNGDYTLALTRYDIGDLSYGDTVEARLEAGIDSAWAFDGDAGQVVQVILASNDIDAQLALYNQYGSGVASDDDSGDGNNARLQYVLTEPGRYVILASAAYDQPGDYTLTVDLLHSSTLEPGETVEGELAEPTGDVWTFQGEPGDIVSISMESRAVDAYLTLYGPQGDGLTNNGGSGVGKNALIRRFHLHEPGTYTLLARDEQERKVGPYTLSLYNAQASATPIRHGDTITGEITHVGGEAWAFTGAEGERVTVAIHSDALNAGLALHGPYGEVASDADSGPGTDALLRNVRLPADGEYTILADASAGERGEYILSFWQIAADASTINYGDMMTGEVSHAGGASWTFTGTAGETVDATLISDAFDPVLALYDPEGEEVAVSDDSGGDSTPRLRATLTLSGAHTLIAYPYADATGPYTLTLAQTTVNTIDYGETVEGQIVDERGSIWTFTGEAGDAVALALNSDIINTALTLYGPDGATAAEDKDSGPLDNARIGPVVLPATGTYTVLAQGQGRPIWPQSFVPNKIGPFALTLEAVEVTPIAAGETLSSTLTATEGQVWSFEGSENEVISLALTGNAYEVALALHAPDGEQLAERSAGDLRMERVALPADGTYRLAVRGLAEAADAYALALNATPATMLAAGETEEAELAAGENVLWLFPAEMGDAISVTLHSEVFTPTLALYDGKGALLSDKTPLGIQMLPVTGTQVLRIGAAGEGSGAYTLAIAQVEPPSIPQVCDMEADDVDYGPIYVGSRVVLGRHRPVEGERRWNYRMGAYVDQEATVTELRGVDSRGCPWVRIDLDNGNYSWRIRDMEFVR